MRFNRAWFGHRPGPQWAFHAPGPPEMDRVAFEGGALLFYSDRQ